MRHLSDFAIHNRSAARAQAGPFRDHAGRDGRYVRDLSTAEAESVAHAHLSSFGAERRTRSRKHAERTGESRDEARMAEGVGNERGHGSIPC